MPESSSGEKYFKRHKNTLPAGCEIVGVTKRKMYPVFLNGAPTNNHKTGTFKFHKCLGKINLVGREPYVSTFYSVQNCISIFRILLLKNEEKCHFFQRIS